MAVVGGNQGQIQLSCKADQHGQNIPLLGHAVILKFNVEVVLPKDLGVAARGLLGALGISLGQKLGNTPSKACRKSDQARGLLAQKLLIHSGLVVKALGKGERDHFHQVPIARHVLAKQDQMVGVSVGAYALVKSGVGSHVDLASDDGLDPLFFAGFPKGDHTVHHAVIGNGNAILSALLDPCGDVRDTAGAVQETVFAVQMQMYKSVHGGSFLQSSSASCRIFCRRWLSPDLEMVGS